MKNGQVFTPKDMVCKMLDLLGYSGTIIKNKKIFEPSFGDGAFLEEIVRRILELYKDESVEEKKQALSCLYGVEINKELYINAIARLNKVLTEYDMYDYSWDNLVLGDTADYKTNVLFDYIVGNPPYIRIHDLDKSIKDKLKKLSLTKGCMDLYVAFFEICVYLLNSTGKLCFITPRSYFTNASQKDLRNYFLKENLLSVVLDYTDVKVFDAGTYTVVTLLDRVKYDTKIHYEFMQSIDEIKYTSQFDVSDWIDKLWWFDTEENVKFLFKHLESKLKIKNLCTVQVAIETNANHLYVLDEDTIREYNIERQILKPVIKASTLKQGDSIIFPYVWEDKAGAYQLISEEVLKSSYPNTYKYLILHDKELLARNMDKNAKQWYQYGRSQGIQNSRNEKYAIKQYVSPELNTCEYLECGLDELVYSGVYLVVNDEKNKDLIQKVLDSPEFYRYLRLVGKRLSGGYRNINTKIVKEYGIIDI